MNVDMGGDQAAIDLAAAAALAALDGPPLMPALLLEEEVALVAFMHDVNWDPESAALRARAATIMADLHTGRGRAGVPAAAAAAPTVSKQQEATEAAKVKKLNKVFKNGSLRTAWLLEGEPMAGGLDIMAATDSLVANA